MTTQRIAVTLLVACLGATPAPAQLMSFRVGNLWPGGYQLFPATATMAPGDPDHFYVAMTNGLVQQFNFRTGALNPTPFLNLHFVGFNAGATLSGLTFHPDYASNGLFYVHYSTGDVYAPGTVARLDSFRRSATNPNAVDLASQQIVLQSTEPNNLSGWMRFGPNDGHLYVGFGDGQLAVNPDSRAQDLSSLRGKMLRLDVGSDQFPTDPLRTDAIPASNPFVNQPGARPEIWASGLRNPWGCSFDRATGDLWIGDVGERVREEINFQPAASPGGENYQWVLQEGSVPTPGAGGPPPPGSTPPIYDYENIVGVGASVTGGFVYRGSIMDQGQALDGTYFFADLMQGRIMSFRYDGVQLTDLRNRNAELLNGFNGGQAEWIVNFVEDDQGTLYMLNFFTGDVFRIQAVPEPGTLAFAAVGVALVAARMVRRRRQLASAAVDAEWATGN